MYLVKLWDRYDREIFINIHKKATPPASNSGTNC